MIITHYYLFLFSDYSEMSSFILFTSFTQYSIILVNHILFKHTTHTSLLQINSPIQPLSPQFYSTMIIYILPTIPITTFNPHSAHRLTTITPTNTPYLLLAPINSHPLLSTPLCSNTLHYPRPHPRLITPINLHLIDDINLIQPPSTTPLI